MNSRNFKLVFNKARGIMMVVNEATSSMQKGGRKAAVAAASAALISLPAAAVVVDNPDGFIAGNESEIIKLDRNTVGGTGIFVHAGESASAEPGVNTKVVREGDLTVKSTVANEAYLAFAEKKQYETFGINVTGNNVHGTKEGRAGFVGSGNLSVEVIAAKPAQQGQMTGSDHAGIEVADGADFNWKGNVTVDVTNRAHLKGISARDNAALRISDGNVKVDVRGGSSSTPYDFRGFSFESGLRQGVPAHESKTFVDIRGSIDATAASRLGYGKAVGLFTKGKPAERKGFEASRNDLVDVNLGSENKGSVLNFAAVTSGNGLTKDVPDYACAAGALIGSSTVTLRGQSLTMSGQSLEGVENLNRTDAWGLGYFDYASVNAKFKDAVKISAKSDNAGAYAIGPVRGIPGVDSTGYVPRGKLVIEGGSIDISAQAAGRADGVSINFGSSISLLTTGELNVSAVSTKDESYAVLMGGYADNEVSGLDMQAGTIALKARSEKPANGLKAAGKLNIKANALDIDVASTKSKATGMGIHASDAVVDAVINVKAVGGESPNTISNGIRLTNYVVVNDNVETYYPGPANVRFKKDATVNVTADHHAVRGVGVLTAKADTANMGDVELRDEGASAFFEGNLSVDAESGVNASGLILDNRWGYTVVDHDNGKGAELSAAGNVTVNAVSQNGIASAAQLANGIEGAETTLNLGSEGKTVSLTARSQESAYGIRTAGWSSVSALGAVNVSAAADKEAYGISAGSHASVTLGSKGSEVSVTAESANGTSTAVSLEKDSCLELLGKATLNGQTALMANGEAVAKDGIVFNGKVLVGAEGSLEASNAAFNGDAVINGLLKSSDNAKYTIAEGRVVELSKQGSGNFDGGLQIVGGSFVNHTGVDVFGILTVDGAKFENHDVVKAGTLELDHSAVFTNSGRVDTDNVYVRNGSTILENASLFQKVDGGLKYTITNTRYQLESGRIGAIGSDLQTVEFEIAGGPGDRGQLDFVGGEYALKGLTLNVHNNRMIDSLVYQEGTKVQIDKLTLTNGTLKVGNGATLGASEINIADGHLVIGDAGNLQTTTANIFTQAMGENGSGSDAGELKHVNIEFQKGSSLTFVDDAYNLDYLWSAYSTLKSSETEKKPTLAFTGKLVNNEGGVLDKVEADKLPEDTVLDNVDLTTQKPNPDNSVIIDKNVGGQTLEVAKGGMTVSVAPNKTLTLVGKAEGGELVNFDPETTGDKKIIASGAEGGLTLGSNGKESKGRLGATVELSNNAALVAQKGTFSIDAVKASDARIDVRSGALDVTSLEVKGETSLNVADNAAARVAKLSVSENTDRNAITITGVVAADEIAVESNASGTINIGTVGSDNRRGDLTIAAGSIKGLTFFLDPTWIEGQKVTEASRLVLDHEGASYSLDGSVVAGHNSYVVIGTTHDKNFVDLFENGTIKWGNGSGETLAAAYIVKPISVSTGSLVVDGSLISLPPTAAAGSVAFGANSVLVADVSTLGNGEALITAGDFAVDASSKAVVVGMTAGQNFKLALDADGDATNFWNTPSTLVSGNSLINLVPGAEGTITASLNSASSVFGSLMQGHALADAGMKSGNAFVNSLLTDPTGQVSAGQMAAQFDAAMNMAGAAAAFTTVYDRAAEFRNTIRGESVGEPSERVWAQLVGGSTKIKGLSTGAQNLHLDTDAYGLAFGGDVDHNGFALGCAFTLGNGETENKIVNLTDDFYFYGVSFYGKTTIGSVDVLADATLTKIKSELAMGGAAKVDAKTRSIVYSLGIQAQKTFDVGLDVTPFIGVDVNQVRGEAYDNGYGAQVADSKATAVEIPFGVNMSKAFETHGFKLSPKFSLAVIPTVGSRDIDSKVRFADAESTYNFTFADDLKVRSSFGLSAEKDDFVIRFLAGYDWGSEERSGTKLMLNANLRI